MRGLLRFLVSCGLPRVNKLFKSRVSRKRRYDSTRRRRVVYVQRDTSVPTPKQERNLLIRNSTSRTFAHTSQTQRSLPEPQRRRHVPGRHALRITRTQPRLADGHVETRTSEFLICMHHRTPFFLERAQRDGELCTLAGNPFTARYSAR